MQNNIENKKEVKPSAWFILIILVLSIIGITDSTYLTIKHYTHSDINCSILDGCNIVTTSTYSTVFGMPVALLGIIFYISIFILVFLLSNKGKKKLLKSLFVISTTGFLMSMWFVYAQAFILNSYCLYCLISAVLSTTIFILSGIMMLKYKNIKEINKNTQYETNN
ncbi:MAG: vitamin K epoxide reductase family protein [Parcubacteria group bacterium]|nr:vitamin K epoxide reductase family protein [Parcubacteria group bacterium]